MTSQWDLAKAAEQTCALARPGERIDVYLQRSHREGFRLAHPEQAIPRGRQSMTLVRLERSGREAYAGLTHWAAPAVTETVEGLRSGIARLGRQVASTTDHHSGFIWRANERTDVSPDRSAILRLADELRRSAEAQRCAIVDAALIVEQLQAAHASSHRGTVSYDRTLIECKAIVSAGGGRSRTTAVQHAHRLERLDPTESLSGAAWTAAAAAAPLGSAPSLEKVILPPRVTSLVLGAVVHDVLAVGRTRVGPSAGLVDDGRSLGAPDAAPFDYDGTPTGVDTVIDTEGRVTLPVSRATARHGDRLGGHAFRQEYDVAPRPHPRNLTMNVSTIEPLPDSAWFAWAVAGAELTHMRSADLLTLRLSVARREGERYTRGPQLVLTASAAEILTALRPIRPQATFLAGTGPRVGAGWAELHLGDLRTEAAT